MTDIYHSFIDLCIVHPSLLLKCTDPSHRPFIAFAG